MPQNTGTSLTKHHNSALPLLLFLLITVPLILSGYDQGRAYFDQHHFHLPVINAFINHLDISDYHAATAPGYHLIFALIGKLTGVNLILFKLLNTLISCLLIGYLCAHLARHYHKQQVLLLILPIMLSLYILPAGVWLVPDNLAWLGVGWVMLQITQAPFSHRQLVVIGLVIALTVMIRQSYLWLVAILWANALASLLNLQRHNEINHYIAKNIAASIPAIGVIIALIVMWQGLVPPSFASIHQHFSPSVAAFFFALFAIYGGFYLPIYWQALKAQANMKIVLIGIVIGFLSVIFIDSTYNIKAGRFSGLWNIVKLTPSIDNKSLLMIVLSSIGGGLFAATMALFSPGKRLMVIATCSGFICTLMVNQFVYERYFSGFIFIMMVMIVTRAVHRSAHHIATGAMLA